MDTSQTAATEKSSLVQDWLAALRYWLGGRRGLIVLAAVVGLAAVALSWGWLVAVGIAPLLLTFAPCAAMCALGLCASRMGAGSCSSKIGTTDNAASQAARPEALSAAAPDPDQLTLGLEDISTTARSALAAPAVPEGAAGTQTPEKEKIHG
jgi:hypothetical protein